MRMTFRAVLIAIGVGLLAGPALAAESPDGARFANACTSCHGIEGHSVGAAPSLAGQAEADLIAKLRAFRDGSASATIMNRITRGYTEAEIEALAAYFSSVSAP